MKNLMYYKNYYGSVHFDDKELIFYGKIQFIKALVSYEAINANVLLEAFEKAVDDYLELCRNQNIEPERPFKSSLNINYPKSV